MAKERKTKRQKQLSDRRHSKNSASSTSEQLYHLDSSNPLQSLSSAKSSPAAVSLADYHYFIHDLKKIAIVTGIIIFLELGIYWISVGF